MAETLVARGDRAFVNEDYAEAVELYTQALEASPKDASVYSARAQAQLKLDNFLEAVEDASKSIELDPSQARAYLHKGIASFKLEEYETALAAFEAGALLAPANTQFGTWKRKCQAEIEDELGASSGPASASKPAQQQPISAKESSPTSVLPPPALAPAGPPAPSPAGPPPTATAKAPPHTTTTTQASKSAPLGPAAAGAPQVVDGAAAAAAALSPAAPAAFQGKYRHQYYQMQNRVTVDVFAKNLAKGQVSVTFAAQRLTVVIADADQGAAGPSTSASTSDGGTAGVEGEYKLDVELYGPVVPEKCRYEVLKTKVEITMIKAKDLQWGSLEKSDKVAANYSDPVAPPVAGQYPSSTTKKKDWSKLETEVKEMEEKGELAEGDPLNAFFQKIFTQGDEDQRRAMIKSFVESNGTVLSTNWAEVGTKKVECTPPDGMEVRKWDK